MSTSSVVIMLCVWLLTAIGASLAGVLQLHPFPFPQILLFSLTLLLIVTSLFVRPLRQWWKRMDPEVLVLPHLGRFVGLYFLVLYSQGRLPYEFAVLGGIGDIIVATLAVAVLARWRAGRPIGRTPLLCWNALGLLDILFVVSTAARIGTADPTAMQELTWLPLSLLVLFLVPIIIGTHVVLFVKSASYRGVS